MDNEEIDIDALKRLSTAIGGDPADLKELLDEYLKTAPTIVERLRANVNDDNATAIRIAAHELKSNARDFGAWRLADLCSELERACLSGETSGVAEAVERIAAAEAVARQCLADPKVLDV